MKTFDELQKTFPDRLMELGVEKKTIRAILESGEQTPAIGEIMRWANNQTPIVILTGGNGCGKTVAACSYLQQHCYDMSKRAYFAAPGDMPPEWKWRGAIFTKADQIATLSAYDHEDQVKHRSLLATSLLVLDELGNEDGDGERGIGRMLCARIDDDSTRTIVTTNLNDKTILERYGRRLYSRLGDAIKIVHGPDLRRE